MVSLGIVLLVIGPRPAPTAWPARVSAAYTVANAVFAIVQGRLVDRLGQSRVLPVAGAVFAVGGGRAGDAAVESGLAGPGGVRLRRRRRGGVPPIGSCVRARWSYVLAGDPAEVQTAFALEAVVDEAVFIIGPDRRHRAGHARGTPGPGSGRAGHRRSAARSPWPPSAAPSRRPQPPRPDDGAAAGHAVGAASSRWRSSAVALGSMFAAAEVATVAFSGEQRAKSYAGVLLALWALGSLLAGLVTGPPWKRPPVFRVQVGTSCWPW